MVGIMASPEWSVNTLGLGLGIPGVAIGHAEALVCDAAQFVIDWVKLRESKS
jgi:hypothetical protein